MTTLQLNSEILRQLSYIVGDESMMTKVLEYIKKVRRQAAKDNGGALSAPADKELETEASELYGMFNNSALPEEDIEAMVSEARREVYGKGK